MVRRAALKDRPAQRVRLPVTLQMLTVFHGRSVADPSFNKILFTACAFLACFGLLRVSELTTPVPNSKKRGPRLSNVALLADRAELTLLNTKTDKSKLGVMVVVAKQGSHPCPVRWLAEYVRRRPVSTQDDLFFVLEDNSPASAVWFRTMLKD